MTPNNPLSRDFAQRLHKLRALAELVESTLVQKVEELNARLNAEAETMSDEQREDFFEYHADDYIELADELPSLLRYSVLTACDSAFESYLNDTCETFAELRSKSVRLNDLKGQGVGRAKEYLKKVAEIQFPDDSPAWTTVNRLHQIRNSIVHEDGYVPPHKAELRRWSGSIPGFVIGATGTIRLHREFTEFALDAYEEFAVLFDSSCENLELWRSVFSFEAVDAPAEPSGIVQPPERDGGTDQGTNQ